MFYTEITKDVTGFEGGRCRSYRHPCQNSRHGRTDISRPYYQKEIKAAALA